MARPHDYCRPLAARHLLVRVAQTSQNLDSHKLQLGDNSSLSSRHAAWLDTHVSSVVTRRRGRVALHTVDLDGKLDGLCGHL